MKRWIVAAMLWVGLALSACNNTDSVLATSGPPPSATIGNPATAPQGSTGADEAGSTLPSPTDLQPAGSAPAAAPGAQTAALSTSARVRFAPIVGATVAAVTPLTRRLSERAAQRGLSLTAGGASDATHLMKGYFSTISDDGATTVIYVWDVLDPAGNRLHRIQGQEPADGAAGPGWDGVPAQTMETIADTTIDQLSAWLSEHAG